MDNRLLEMTYPDGETVSYGYNLGGQLDHVRGYKSYGYDYVNKIGYDKFEQRSYLKYCNDVAPTMAKAKAACAIDGNLTELNLGGTRQNSSKLVLPSFAQGFKPNDDYEKLQFYYHPDHLGCSSYITNLDGEVVQHIEYVPFGEVFFEERNNVWNTPYLFNAKEYDEETGLYYYGARYYEPRISLWMSTDPLQEKSSDISTYTFCHNNPANLLDLDGKDDYKIDQNGNLEFWRKTNAKSTHRVFSGKDNITIDKRFVNQLYENQSTQGTSAKTSKSDDAFKFFKFAADHTKVEWSLIGEKTKNGVIFNIHSDFEDDEVSLEPSLYKNMVFQLHNHPRGTNPKGTKASGHYESYKRIKENQEIPYYYVGDDLLTLNDIYNTYKEHHPTVDLSQYPKSFIYYSGDERQKPQLFQYDLNRPKFGTILNPSYLQIREKVYK